MKTKFDGKYNKTILQNGIRVVSEKIPWVSSVCVGAWVDVGSRDENQKESGLSHLIEHMLFKGTKRRSAKQIALALESIGGSLNAFTGRENTCYYAKVLDENLDSAIDLLSDILKNPLFDPVDFKKEKRVIIEEIKDAEDTPSDLVFDFFTEALWKNQTLGEPILGTVESVKRIKRTNLLAYFKRNYIPPKIVICASGNLSHENLVKMVRKKFDKNFRAFSFHRTDPKIEKKPIPYTRKMVTEKEIAQTHICIGFPAFDFNHPQKYPALVLSNILGGGMSSRLFQTVREKLGVAYNIYSFFDFYIDSGIFGVYLGTNQKNTQLAVEAVLREFSKIKNDRLPKTELKNAKYQLKGNLILGAESISYRMSRLARHELYSQDYWSLKKSILAIEGVKAKEVKEVAEKILDSDKVCITILGPVKTGVIKKIDWGLF